MCYNGGIEESTMDEHDIRVMIVQDVSVDIHGDLYGHERVAEALAHRLRVMEAALQAAQSFIADGGLADTDPGASIYRQVTTAMG